MTHPLRRPFEYGLARFAMGTLPLLPRRAILRLAHLLGGLGYLLMRRQRAVGMANLALALPDRTPEQHRLILRQSLSSFALVVLDTCWLARDTQARLAGLVTFHPTFTDTILKPGAQICLTAHMGNWEVLGLAVSQKGFPLTSVTAPLKNPWIEDLSKDLRKLAGQQPVTKRGAVRSLLKVLRQDGKIALVLDQNTKPAQGGLFVDFFGLKAPISAAAAQLARRTGAPLIIGACVPDGHGRYFTPPARIIDQTGLPAGEAEAVYELTQRIAHGLEDLIRSYPAYWIWTYKRWKIRPDGEDPARYPFYTRPIRAGDLPARGGIREE